ncbi:MAG: hypothetical protein KAS77_01750 [Thermoplasmata archaeon]|nr:hypothetical protein [Thermoplasmata archaeon]
MPREDDEEDEKSKQPKQSKQPKRERVETVPLGLRKPDSPRFEPAHFSEEQRMRDEETEEGLLKKAEKGSLEPPELHQDYEIRDGDETDRHLEGVSSLNALKEMIALAKEEVEDEMGVKPKPFSRHRLDRLIVFTHEAVTGYGEEAGYAELKKRIRELIEEDQQAAAEELERKKKAYLRRTEK